MRINGRETAVPAAWEESTLLEFLRDHLGLTGTKYGCGIGQCGACTVHVDGAAGRACLLKVAQMATADVTTIEGLSEDHALHPVQAAWAEGAVPQCGYCQPGQIMSAAALLAHNPDPSDAEITAAMAGNLCRCGTYVRIRESVRRAAIRLAGDIP